MFKVFDKNGCNRPKLLIKLSVDGISLNYLNVSEAETLFLIFINF